MIPRPYIVTVIDGEGQVQVEHILAYDFQEAVYTAMIRQTARDTYARAIQDVKPDIEALRAQQMGQSEMLALLRAVEPAKPQ